MITLESVTKKHDAQPPRLLIYGGAGIGKSTLGANAPNPIFLRTEDGLGKIKADAFPLVTSLDEVGECLEALKSQKHEFKTLVVDSLDWLEPIIWKEVCQNHGKANIEDFGYGKGFVMADAIWSWYLSELDWLKRDGMTIIQIAHSQVKVFNDPRTEPYDRYEIKLHKRAAALMMEFSDAVLFAGYEINQRKIDQGFNKEVVKPRSTGRRVLCTEDQPAYVAKNRFGMPAQIPLKWEEIQKYL